ncbi:MAG: arylamine N-acetyltransferase [Acidobacteriota bacterium]|nr:MAG: arylamine N-acetyltransferase [Acidobacteriota bacterium]
MHARDYLERIHADPNPEPTLATLGTLHEQHLYAVPFENLDIHFGVPIVLDQDKILAKVVTRRRGGFCYELNTAFAWLLAEIGYDVTMLSAEVSRPDGGFGIPFDHMVLEVDIDGSPWLVDVGFGDGFLHPIPLVENAEGEYRLARDGNDWFLTAGSTSKYRFTLTPRRLADYEDACRYHQSSDESMFTQRVVATRATPGGRITLTPKRLIRHHGTPGERTEIPIANDTEWRHALEEHFDIVLEHVSCSSDNS